MKDMINEKVRKMAMILFLSLAIGCLSSCSDDDDSPSVAPSASGVVQDMDGNEYHWVRIGNLDWMTDNLRCGTPSTKMLIMINGEDAACLFLKVWNEQVDI